MRVLFIVLFLCVVILLWAAISVARHIQRHSAERQNARAERSNESEQHRDPTGVDPAAGHYEGE